MLAVGSDADLDTLRLVLDLLPEGAYGQVIVRSDDALQTPPRVTVHHVRDDAELAEAVAAWTAEWMPDEHDDPDRAVSLWIGADAAERLHGTCPAVHALAVRL